MLPQVHFPMRGVTQSLLTTFSLFSYDGDDDRLNFEKHAEGSNFEAHVLSMCRSPFIVDGKKVGFCGKFTVRARLTVNNAHAACSNHVVCMALPYFLSCVCVRLSGT